MQIQWNAKAGGLSLSTCSRALCSSHSPSSNLQRSLSSRLWVQPSAEPSLLLQWQVEVLHDYKKKNHPQLHPAKKLQPYTWIYFYLEAGKSWGMFWCLIYVCEVKFVDLMTVSLWVFFHLVRSSFTLTDDFFSGKQQNLM